MTTRKEISDDEITWDRKHNKYCYEHVNCLEALQAYKKERKENSKLKAECEEWKNKYYNSTTEVKADLINTVNQLKAENEELKKKNNYLERRVKGEIHLGNSYKKDFADQVVERQKAEQKLERIKEIANNIVQDCFYKDFECDDCDIKISCPFVCRKQILQIIESEEK